MDIDIYVQSCGISQEQDYHWRKIISFENQQREIPSILREASRTLFDKYDSQERSIVLARKSNKLLLLVTALKATERTKIHGYQVRNSVALVTPYSDKNEQTLRKIVVHATQHWETLRNVIDEAVDFEPQDGFRVKREKIEQYVKTVQEQVTSCNVSSPDPKIHVVFWGISQNAGEGDTKKNSQYIFLALCLLLILIVAIALITQILPGTQREEIPPTALPTPQSQVAPTATPSPIPQNQVTPTVTPSPISDSQPNQTMLQPQTITMPSATDTPTNPSTEPIKTKQSSPQTQILPMKSH